MCVFLRLPLMFMIDIEINTNFSVGQLELSPATDEGSARHDKGN